MAMAPPGTLSVSSGREAAGDVPPLPSLGPPQGEGTRSESPDRGEVTPVRNVLSPALPWSDASACATHLAAGDSGRYTPQTSTVAAVTCEDKAEEELWAAVAAVAAEMDEEEDSEGGWRAERKWLELGGV